MVAPIDRRRFIAALPALALAPRALAQSPARFRVDGLSQITLTVSDVARSLDFYQGLFGMPVQARQGSTRRSSTTTISASYPPVRRFAKPSLVS
jgi:hypothetical protein